MFFVPRTGTNTLRIMFETTGIPLTMCNDSHAGFEDLEIIFKQDPDYTNLDLNDFKLYSFYRNPFDRCISVVNYLRRGKQCAKFFHAFFGDEYPLPCAYRKPYAEWTAEMQQMCDSVPMIEVFRKFKWFFERGVYGKTHKRWLDGPIIPLNFDDYDNEVRRVLGEFGVDPSTVSIPHINPSTTLPEYDGLSNTEKAEIMEFLDEDYEFLASKGIEFNQ